MVKKFLLVLFSIIIIVFSFVMPNLLLSVEDMSREKEIFARQKIERKIDVEAEKIYLVTFIHNIYQIKEEKLYYGDKKTVTYSMPMTQTRDDVDAPTEEFKNEVSKLVTNEIINEISFDEYLDYFEEVNTFPSEYIVVTCGMPKSKKEWISINIEQKTGKMISVDFSKNFLKYNVEREKQLRNYARYLDLDIIDDWEFEKDALKSEKAQLTIILVEKDDSCLLTIAPTEEYEEYVEQDNAIQREYKIVEKEKEKIKK